MKFKTRELTGDNLKRALALAQDWSESIKFGFPVYANKDGNVMCAIQFYDPEHDWSQCGELIDKFNISLTFEEDGFWSATCYDENTNEGEDVGLGKTPQQAICRCVVASVYGYEVEL